MKKIIYKDDEGTLFDMTLSEYDEFHGITLCSMVLNEGKIMQRFLEHYKPYVDSIAIMDGGSCDGTIDVAAKYAENIKVRKFDGHWSNQSNRCMEMAKTDWILFMDADELIEEASLKRFKEFIDQDKYDCYAFPRKEYLDDVGEYNKIIYPDYQDRLFRSYCRRVRPVHCEVVGYKSRCVLPMEDGYNIIHKKTKKRHESRNIGYQMFELNFINEMMEPGGQKREDFDKFFEKHVTESRIKNKVGPSE